MENFARFGAIVVPAIIAVVQLLKMLRVPTYWLPLVDVILGLLAGILFYLMRAIPSIQEPLTLMGFGLLAGLSAAKVYDYVGDPIKRKSTRPPT